jgi:predicted Zn-dependent protease
VTAPAIARAGLVAAAVAAVLLLVAWDRAEAGCTDSVKSMLFALRDRAPAGELDATLDAIEGDCDGSSRLVDAAGVLFQEGHPDRAARLLRTAVRREPDNFSAWAGLASALARSDRAGSASAAARAKRLNPDYRPPS